MEDTKNNSTQPLPNPPSVSTRSKESGVTASVEVVSERPIVSPDLSKYVHPTEQQVPVDQASGIAPSGPQAPVNTEPKAKVNMSDAEIEAALKQGAGHAVSIKNLTNRDEDTKNEYVIDSRFGYALIMKKVSEFKKLFGNKLKHSPKPV